MNGGPGMNPPSPFKEPKPLLDEEQDPLLSEAEFSAPPPATSQQPTTSSEAGPSGLSSGISPSESCSSGKSLPSTKIGSTNGAISSLSLAQVERIKVVQGKIVTLKRIMKTLRQKNAEIGRLIRGYRAETQRVLYRRTLTQSLINRYKHWPSFSYIINRKLITVTNLDGIPSRKDQSSQTNETDIDGDCEPYPVLPIKGSSSPWGRNQPSTSVDRGQPFSSSPMDLDRPSMSSDIMSVDRDRPSTPSGITEPDSDQLITSSEPQASTFALASEPPEVPIIQTPDRDHQASASVSSATDFPVDLSFDDFVDD